MEPLLICNLHFDCFIGEHAPICSWFIVGIVGPLTPLPVSLSVRSIGRGRSVVVAVNPCSRLDCLRLSLPYPSAALSLSLSPPSLLPSFPPSTPAAIVRQSNNWYRRSRSPSFSTWRREGKDEGAATSWSQRGATAQRANERASQVFTSSAADQCSSSLSLSLSLSLMKEVSAAAASKTVETAG